MRAALALLAALGLAACSANEPRLTRIVISPEVPVVARGASIHFVAAGLYSDGAVRDITAEVAWTVSDRVVAEADEGAAPGAVRGLMPGTTRVFARKGWISGSRVLKVQDAAVNSLEVSPAEPVAPVGVPLQLRLVAVFSDATSREVTAEALWTVDGGGASFSPANPGLVTGTAVGLATVLASWEGVSLRVQVRVTDATVMAVELSPRALQLPVGTSGRLAATATLSDRSSQDVTESATWRSSDPSVAFVASLAGERGKVAARAQGEARISAELGRSTGGASVTISNTRLVGLELSPASPVLATGFEQAFTLTGVYDDDSVLDVTHAATWGSSAPFVAQVVAAGRVRGQGPGTAVVKATLNGVEASATLTVTAAALSSIAIGPARPQVARGTYLPLSAVGTFSDGTSVDLTEQVLWLSDAPAVAAVSNLPGQRGLLRGVATGTAAVTAQVRGVLGRAPVTVTPAVLERIEVGPPDVQLPMGLSQPLRATGVFSDGSTQDLTATATWTSSDAQVASVSNAGPTRGLVSAMGAGAAQVQASQGGHVGAANVVVTSATLRALSLTPATLVVPTGSAAQVLATGIFTDDSTRDLTADVAWSSEDPTVATVSNAGGSQGQVRGVAMGAVLVEASLDGLTARVPVAVTAAQLVSLEISPASVTLAAGLTRALAAIGTWSDGTTRALTDQVTWSSSDPAVADVSNTGASPGVLTARQVGAVIVRASMGSVAATAPVTVSQAHLVSLSLTPPSPSMPLGSTLQVSATGTYSDASTQDLTGQVSWTSSDESRAWVSPTGEVRARAQGTVTVSAVLLGVSGTAAVTVTPATFVALELSPVSASAPLGTSVAFTATGRYSDGSAVDVTGQVTWESLTPAIAQISTAAGTAGQATGLTEGTATLRATWQGRQATAPLIVTAAVLAAIAVSPTSVRLASGTLGPLRATGTWSDGSTADVTDQVTWTSSEPSVATVSNASITRGWAFAGQPGSATVTASLGSRSGTTSVTITNALATAISVTPSLPSAPAGLGQALAATATFSDGTTQDVTELASWASSSAALAVVSDGQGAKGVVTGVAPGTPIISASALGRTGSVAFTVTDALLFQVVVTPAASSAPLGTTPRLTAMGTFTDGSSRDVSEQATWTSAAPAVAVPSNAAGERGRLTTLSQGTTTLTAAVGSIQAAAQLTVTAAVIASVGVTPAAPSVPLGTTQQLIATATFTDGTTQDVSAQASFTSSDVGVATVSNAVGHRGLVTPISVGTATVTATVGTVSGPAAISVTPALLVSLGVTPVAVSLPLGRTQALVATGVYSDSTTRDLTSSATWTTSDAGKVAVSNVSGSEGVVSSMSVGSATVTAAVGTVSARVTVAATPAVLQAVQVTPAMPSVPLGLTRQLTATGVYSDGTTQDLTASAAWTSSDAAVAVVSTAAGSEGILQARAQGTVTVSAGSGSFTGSTQVTVTPAVLQQLQVTPANVSTPKGVGRQLTATGVYSDTSTEDLTTQVTWASSDAAKVAVSNAGGSEGFAAALATGTVTVSASLGGVVGGTPFTVTPALLVDVTVSPTAVAATVGTVRALGAVGTYTDGSTQVLTTQAAWTVADSAVAFVSNAPGSEGLVTMLSAGTTSVRAQVGARSGQATLSVTQATLVSIDLAPASSSTPLGFARQFIAFGTYSNGATQILTNQVTWASSDPTRALISNAAGSQGLLSTVATGSLTVSATWQGVTGATPHTVTAAVLVSLAVTPGAPTIPVGGSAQLSATGSFSDGSQQALTDSVTWTSSVTGVAQVSNAAGTEGQVAGLASGTAAITAALGGVQSTVNVTVQ